MKYVFPYQKIKKESTIILYGAGDVGKEFYLQVHLSGYCSVVAWVDRSFEGYELDKPFDYVCNLGNYDADYIVIAVLKENMAKEIKEALIKMGIDEKKIVWSHYYALSKMFFPTNRIRYLKHLDFYMNLMDTYIASENIYSSSGYYQNYKELGIAGGRDNGERIAFYHLRDLLSIEDVVLDIGCNCGFFDMQVAPYVKKLVGVDVIPEFIEIANKVRDFQGIKNVEFRCADFFENISDEKYNAIFMLAMHGLFVEKYIEQICSIIEPGGYLFFESHDLNNDAEVYRNLCRLFVEAGLKERIHENHCFGGDDRDIIVFQKEI